MRDGCSTRIARKRASFGFPRATDWTAPKFSTVYTDNYSSDSSRCVRVRFPLADFFMAQRNDVERGRAIVERWRTLAEQRLDYLNALQESGRWQRFHSEPDFLDNLREARDAVETWRLLASREASLDNRPIDFGWLGQGAVPLARRDMVRRDDRAVAVTPIPSPPIPSPPVLNPPVLNPPISDLPIASRPIPSPPVAPAIDVPSVADALPAPAASLDLATMRDRYPLLRNAL